MKKLIFISFIFISAICNAQTERGKLLLSGNTNASISYYDDGSGLTNFNFASSIGVFIINNFAIGVYGNIQSVTYDSYYGKSTQTIYEIAPFLRCYIPSKNEILKPYLEIEGGLIGNGNLKGSFFTGSLGLAIFINRHISIDPAFKFANSKWENAGKSSSNYGLNIGLSVYLGKDKQ